MMFNKLIELISKNNLEEFFCLSNDFLNIILFHVEYTEIKEIKNELIILSQNYYMHRSNRRKGIINLDDLQVQNNRIINSLLEWLYGIKKKGLFEIASEIPTGSLQNKFHKNNIHLGFQVEKGNEKGRIYDLGILFGAKTFLKGGRLSISHAEKNDINIVDTDNIISRKHFTLKIIKSDDEIMRIKIFDGQYQQDEINEHLERSRNGIIINGRKEVESILKIGDRIELGNTMLVVIGL